MEIQKMKEFIKNKQVIDCKLAHKHSCLLNTVVKATVATWNYKKPLLMIFFLKEIRNFGKKNNDFFTRYYRYFRNPLLFMFFFNLASRWMHCKLKNKKFRNKKNMWFSQIISSSIASLFEREQRIQQLGIYCYGTTQNAMVNAYLKKYKLTKYKKLYQTFLYCFTFGLFLDLTLNRKIFSDKQLTILQNTILNNQINHQSNLSFFK